MSPIPPVEAARRADGGIMVDSPFASGARAIAWAVVSCKASMALMGDVILVAFALDVNDDSSRSAAFFDDDRIRTVEPDPGGGGKAPPEAATGESATKVEWVEIG